MFRKEVYLSIKEEQVSADNGGANEQVEQALDELSND